MGGSRTGEQPNKRAAALERLGPGRTILALHYSEKPTIAAVNGVVVGGGFGLCSAFDIRIASEEARFGTIFIKRGLAPDYGLSWYLPRIVGHQRARELFYSGRIVNAQEALELGIVTKVAPPDQLMDETLGFAREIAKHPPTALTYTKRALRQSYSNTIEAQLEFEWANQKASLQSAEFREAAAAFMEKREADFSKL
jgi:2-(1,2-epoxy-1,2-dihydrophenyl)acetyl-CoA isomerase